MGNESCDVEHAWPKRRYVIAFLSLWITTICYADRTNFGIAVLAFVESVQQQGQVHSAFYFGYMVTQLLGGFLASKFGAKGVLLGGVVVWTLFDLSTVIVSSNVAVLFLARAGMGLGEGILFPCMHQLAGVWYPMQERGRIVAIVSGGTDLGTVLALIVSPMLMAAFGWPRIFEFFALLSFAWVFTFWYFGSSDPENDPMITSEEREFVVANRSIKTTAFDRNDERDPAASMNWTVLLTSRPAWAVYIAHFCLNYGWYVLLGWTPQYFRQVLRIDLASEGIVAALPYICGYLGGLFFGRLGDELVNRGHRVLYVRQAMNATGLVGAALCLFLLRFAHTSTVAVGTLCMTLFLARAALSGYWVNMIDIGPRNAAHVMAVSNTIATVPGILGNIATGYLLASTGDWNLVFAVASGVMVVDAVVFQLWSSDEPMYDKKSVRENASQEEMYLLTKH